MFANYRKVSKDLLMMQMFPRAVLFSCLLFLAGFLTPTLVGAQSEGQMQTDAGQMQTDAAEMPTDTGAMQQDTGDMQAEVAETPAPGRIAGPVPEISDPQAPYAGFPTNIPPVPAPEQMIEGTTPSSPEEVEQLANLYLPHAMLFQSGTYARQVVGDAAQWNGPYMQPEPELMTEEASEILTLYPRSLLTPEGQNVFETLADEELWQALSEIGFNLMHPTAFQQAGSVVGTDLQYSVDGGFDRISLIPEPLLGDAEDVRQLVETTRDFDAIIAGDIIPLHLGAGYDFRLAQMNYADYPGLFNMIEVPEEMWDMLPMPQEDWGFHVMLNDEIEPFIDNGLVPGRFDVLLGREATRDWSGWCATGPILGVDGQVRRWLYAFMFKPEQPALNWMDPTYNARYIQAADIIRHVEDYGTIINRLDAVPFLGLEPQADSPLISIYATPLAINGTDDLAFMHRKLGGWTWVELNVPASDYKVFMENGPDVGYDFFTRAQTVHPLITGDARILRVAHRSLLDADIDHSRLIHELQNHDEIAYQLINLRSQEQVQYGDETLGGTELADRILSQMQQATAPPAAPYNALYRPAQNGLATTYAGFIGPALGINPYEASPEQVDTIKQAHVMLAVVNAMQPGVFGVSQWDLVGALPVDRDLVTARIDEGDMRWLNRGAVDLMGTSEASTSAFGLPEAQNLYGPIPQQLEDPESFASQVRDIIQARKRYDISDAEVLAVPALQSQAIFALVMRLPDNGGYAVTAANYSRDPASVTIDLGQFVQGSAALQGTPRDIIADSDAGTFNGTQLTFDVEGLTGRTIVIEGAPGVDNGMQPGAPVDNGSAAPIEGSGSAAAVENGSTGQVEGSGSAAIVDNGSAAGSGSAGSSMEFVDANGDPIEGSGSGATVDDGSGQ
ncbi:MAG: hypothetical protein R2940_07440 [Syntrophotaleaceae bacterium]